MLLSYAIMRQHRFDSIAAMIESSEREATALCGNGEGQDEINRRLFVTFAAGFLPPAPLTPTVRAKPGSCFEGEVRDREMRSCHRIHKECSWRKDSR